MRPSVETSDQSWRQETVSCHYNSRYQNSNNVCSHQHHCQEYKLDHQPFFQRSWDRLLSKRPIGNVSSRSFTRISLTYQAVSVARNRYVAGCVRIIGIVAASIVPADARDTIDPISDVDQCYKHEPVCQKENIHGRSIGSYPAERKWRGGVISSQVLTKRFRCNGTNASNDIYTSSD